MDFVISLFLSVFLIIGVTSVDYLYEMADIAYKKKVGGTKVWQSRGIVQNVYHFVKGLAVNGGPINLKNYQHCVFEATGV